MSTLAPCPHCNRHALLDEESCPFCGESMEGAVAGSPSQGRNIRRVAAIAAMAASLSGCPDGMMTGAVPPYGIGPEPDVQVPDPDAGEPDGGDPDAGGLDDDGGP